MPHSKETKETRRVKIKETPLEQHDGWILAVRAEKKTLTQ